MKTYFDSSSFAKRYIEESGSDILDSICQETDYLGLSVISAAEIISALNRRKRERSIRLEEYILAKSHLIADIRDAEIIELTNEVISRTISILEKSPVRTLDAIHVASACHWNADLFVSSDTRQLKAAEEAGLKIRLI